MSSESDIYRSLQEHLNKMPVGFPATESGVEINILQEIFTPEEADILSRLDYKYKSVDAIVKSSNEELGPKEDLTVLLDRIVSKGGIKRRKGDVENEYALVPLALWGIFEQQIKRLSPEFLLNFGKYMQNEFGYELASSGIPKTRIIPVERSISFDHKVSTYDELRYMIEQAGDQIAVQDCICRKINDQQGKNCQMTGRREVCMSFGDLADMYVDENWGRKISQNEALEIARKNEEDGLVMMPGNYKESKYMCACCSDCCGMLSVLKYMPRPADAVASTYYAETNKDLCKACQTCVKRCPTEAIQILNEKSDIELSKCIGCGLCVPTCPEKALSLVKKEHEQVPPDTEEDMLDLIMESKISKR